MERPGGHGELHHREQGDRTHCLDRQHRAGAESGGPAPDLEKPASGWASGLDDLHITESPWIAEREWTICPWTPQNVRGIFSNPFADNRLNIWSYGDRQLADYVTMYDAFGYSGVQLMETSYSYNVFGSPEAFQSRQREIAKDARDNGRNVSLSVWAAEFNGHGWIDPDLTYEPTTGRTACDDPAVRRGFEEYYDLYARLAPYVDRLIGHFYGPGNLKDRKDWAETGDRVDSAQQYGWPRISFSRLPPELCSYKAGSLVVNGTQTDASGRAPMSSSDW